MADSYPLTRTHLPQAGLSTLEALAAIPEEEVWLAKQKSPRTRRAYRQDVEHFMKTIGVRSREELRSVDHKAVIAWERCMREVEGAQSSTIKRPKNLSYLDHSKLPLGLRHTHILSVRRV